MSFRSLCFARRGRIAAAVLDRFCPDAPDPFSLSAPLRAVWFFWEARLDPFFPASVPGAIWFVASNWRWLHSDAVRK